MPPQNRIEQDEPKHAVDVQKDEPQHNCSENSNHNQSDELRDVLGNVRVIEWEQPIWHARLQKLVLILVWDARPITPEVSEIASADMQFRRQNSNQRQARPLSEAETSEELFARVLQGGLYTINGGNRHETDLTLTYCRAALGF